MARKLGNPYPRIGFEKGRQGSRPVVKDFSKIVGNLSLPHGGPISEANRGLEFAELRRISAHRRRRVNGNKIPHP